MSTSSSGQQPALCKASCGFFGNPATEGLCSKCFRDRAAAAPAASPSSVNSAATADANAAGTAEGSEASSAPARPLQVDTSRCFQCRKKVGLLGFTCNCEYVFCGKHRYPDEHTCTFDFKTRGREQLSAKHEAVVAPKLEKI